MDSRCSCLYFWRQQNGALGFWLERNLVLTFNYLSTLDIQELTNFTTYKYFRKFLLATTGAGKFDADSYPITYSTTIIVLLLIFFLLHIDFNNTIFRYFYNITITCFKWPFKSTHHFLFMTLSKLLTYLEVTTILSMIL